MRSSAPELNRVLGIAPISHGFGFALMEGEGGLIDWGVKIVKGGNKNARCLLAVASLMRHYRPDAIAIEDPRLSRRGSRVKKLIEMIGKLARKEMFEVRFFSQKELKKQWNISEPATKQKAAELLALEFPEELSWRLPRKRRAWTSEDDQMGLFEAVALARQMHGM